MKATNLTGKTFGRWTVVERVSNRGLRTNASWKCECQCGKIGIVVGYNLTSGHSQSCGCLRKERILESVTKHKQSPKNGSSAEYKAWHNMKQRCNNPNNTRYRDYGGRGITVCREWDTFHQFFLDMGLKTSINHTIDRINNEQGYSKDNCKWSTISEQANNKRTNKSYNQKKENNL